MSNDSTGAHSIGLTCAPHHKIVGRFPIRSKWPAITTPNLLRNVVQSMAKVGTHSTAIRHESLPLSLSPAYGVLYTHTAAHLVLAAKKKNTNQKSHESTATTIQGKRTIRRCPQRTHTRQNQQQQPQPARLIIAKCERSTQEFRMFCIDSARDIVSHSGDYCFVLAPLLIVVQWLSLSSSQ